MLLARRLFLLKKGITSPVFCLLKHKAHNVATSIAADLKHPAQLSDVNIKSDASNVGTAIGLSTSNLVIGSPSLCAECGSRFSLVSAGGVPLAKYCSTCLPNHRNG